MIDFIKRSKKKAVRTKKAVRVVKAKRSKIAIKVPKVAKGPKRSRKKKLNRNKFGANVIKDMVCGESQRTYLNNPRIQFGLVNKNENPNIRTALLIVDPQNDFVKDDRAIEDMINIIGMIDDHGSKISDIFVTLDSHNRFGITNPMFWKNSETNLNPAAGTIITREEFESGLWEPARKELFDDAYEYIIALEDNNREPLKIWEEHCIIGTWGSLVYGPLMEAIEGWERKFIKAARYIPKGSDSLRDQFGAVRSEDRVISKDEFVSDLDNYTRVLVCGEVLQICVKNSIQDLLELSNIPIILLSDASTVTLDGYDSSFIESFKKEFSNFSTNTTEEVFDGLEWNTPEKKESSPKQNVQGPSKEKIEVMRNTSALKTNYKPIAYDKKGMPINPYIQEKDSYRGIGDFEKIGPNFYLKLLISRKYNDAVEYIMTNDNKIPSFNVDDLMEQYDIDETDQLYDYIIRNCINDIFTDIDSTKFNYELLYAGYYSENDDNILNAWKEISVYKTVVPKEEFFKSQDLSSGYRWSSEEFSDIDKKLLE